MLRVNLCFYSPMAFRQEILWIIWNNLVEIWKIKENRQNPSAQAATTSLMLCLCSFTCKPGFQIKAPSHTINLFRDFNLTRRKTSHLPFSHLPLNYLSPQPSYIILQTSYIVFVFVFVIVRSCFANNSLTYTLNGYKPRWLSGLEDGRLNGSNLPLTSRYPPVNFRPLVTFSS